MNQIKNFGTFVIAQRKQHCLARKNVSQALFEFGETTIPGRKLTTLAERCPIQLCYRSYESATLVVSAATASTPQK